MDIGEHLSESELCPPDPLSEQEAAFARDIQGIHSRSTEFVSVSCPACAAQLGTIAFEKFGFAFQECPGCRTLYMNPRPSEEVLADYYANSENYRIWAEQFFPASEANRKRKSCVPWLNRIVEHCDTYQIPRDVLIEVGPGFGTFAQLATESNTFRHLIAVEPSPELADACRDTCRDRGMEVMQCRIEDIEEVDIPRASVVVAFEVIEHLFEPTQFLQSAHTLLDDADLLILSCPNGMGFDIDMLGPKSLAVDAEHVNLFNPKALTMLLDRCGFETLDISTPGPLDAELVRDASVRGEVELDAFLNKVMITDWETLGWPLQQFRAINGLSAHMWSVARKKR